MNEFPVVPIDGGSISKKRIAIATTEFNGPNAGGGIGAANCALAEALAEDGHEVTVFYLVERRNVQALKSWLSDDNQPAYSFRWMERTSVDCGFQEYRANTSYLAYEWLKSRQFDVIHFNEWTGLPYYSMLAKRQGLAFQSTLMCVTAHGPEFWSRSGNNELPHESAQLAVYHLERYSVEYADVLLSPSHHMLRWMQSQSWVLPVMSYYCPNIVGERFFRPRSSVTEQNITVKDIVFFGRLEFRKGLDIFCSVVESLLATTEYRPRVYFLGNPQWLIEYQQFSDLYLKNRAVGWELQWEIVSGLDSSDALGFLKESDRLAIVPSRADNAPYTVLECLFNQVPFIASDSGGIPELIAPGYRQKCCVSLDNTHMLEAITNALEVGHPLAECAFDPQRAKSRFLGWHSTVEIVRKEMGEIEAEPSLVVLAGRDDLNDRLVLQMKKCFDYEGRCSDIGAVMETYSPGTRQYVLVIASGCTVQDELPAQMRHVLKYATPDIITSLYMENEETDGLSCRSAVTTVVPAGNVLLHTLNAVGSDGVYLVNCRVFDSSRVLDEFSSGQDWILAALLEGFSIEQIPHILYNRRRKEQMCEDMLLRHRSVPSIQQYQERVDKRLYDALLLCHGLVELAEVKRQQRKMGVGKQSGFSRDIFRSCVLRGGKVITPDAFHCGAGKGLRTKSAIVCCRSSFESGHCVYGPNWIAESECRIQLVFVIQVLSGQCDGSELVSLDVYDNKKDNILVHKTIAQYEEETEIQYFHMASNVNPDQVLEFRVFWHGNHDIVFHGVTIN